MERAADGKDKEGCRPTTRRLSTLGEDMPYRVSREHFGELAERALREIPRRYRRYFRNVAIIVEDYPSDDVVEETGIHRHALMGLFRGQAYGDKDSFFAIPSPYPDSIYLYQKNIESVSETEEELMDEIRMTMLHEVGHYFGLSEEDLEDFEG